LDISLFYLKEKYKTTILNLKEKYANLGDDGECIINLSKNPNFIAVMEQSNSYSLNTKSQIYYSLIYGEIDEFFIKYMYDAGVHSYWTIGETFETERIQSSVNFVSIFKKF
jgi:hypothetical protein